MMLKYLIQTSIFCYSKNYGSLTHETRIKDAVNMGDLICLLATVRTLKLIHLFFLKELYHSLSFFYGRVPKIFSFVSSSSCQIPIILPKILKIYYGQIITVTTVFSAYRCTLLPRSHTCICLNNGCAFYYHFQEGILVYHNYSCAIYIAIVNRQDSL